MIFVIANGIVNLFSSACCHIGNSGYTGCDVWKQHRDNSNNTLESKAKAYFRETSISFFWDCGYNKLKKFSEGNLVFVDITWNSMSFLEIRQWNNVWWGKAVISSASTLSNCCSWGHSLTVEVIQNHMPSRNIVSLASDRETSKEKLATMWVKDNNMNRNGALWEVQLAFDQLGNLFNTYFNNKFSILGQEMTLWSQIILTLNQSSGSFQAQGRQFTWY